MSLRSRFHDHCKSLDAVLGRAGATWVKRSPVALPARPRDVLLVRLWGLGNLTLLAPLLLAGHRRGLRLRLITLARNAEFVAAHFPWVSVLPVPDPGSPAFGPACLWTAARLRREPPDVVVDMEQFLRLPLVLVRAACRAPVVGLDTPHQGRGPLLDVPVPHDALRHVAHTFACVWRAAGLPPANDDQPHGLQPDAVARRRLQERLPPGPGPLVVLHPGSGDHFPGRRWPPARFGRLAQQLHQRGARLLLSGSSAERALLNQVGRHARGGALDLCGQLDAPGLVALLSLADLLVTNDTGPLHMADAVGTRAVALYGPNTPHRYGPRLAGSLALFADLPCSPCLDDRSMKRSACRHYACMDALSEAAVLDACERVLAGCREPALTAPGKGHAVPG